MCGRQRCTLDGDAIERVTRVPSRRWIDMERYRSSYNVAPGFYTPVVRIVNRDQLHRDRGEARGRGGEVRRGEGEREGGEGEPEVGERGGGVGEGGEGERGRGEVEGGRGEGERERAVQCMKWGLVPSFTKKLDKPDHYRMFNARSESVHEKASFRRLLPRNRCLVLSEGFYEWKKDGSKKQPYYIYLKNGDPLVFAGLYDRWEDDQGSIMYTYTVLTTRVSKRLEWLHDRMPVILNTEESREAWLDGELKLEDIVKLTQPYEESDLIWHAVSPAMGKPSVDGPQCIAELKASKENAIKNFFSKQTQQKVEETKEGKGEQSQLSDSKSSVNNNTGFSKKNNFFNDEEAFSYGNEESKPFTYEKEDVKPFKHEDEFDKEDVKPLKHVTEELIPLKQDEGEAKPFNYDEVERRGWKLDRRKDEEKDDKVIRNSEGQLPSFEDEERAKEREKSIETDNIMKIRVIGLNVPENLSDIDTVGGKNERKNEQNVVNMGENPVLFNHAGKKHPREVTTFNEEGKERKHYHKLGSSMENFNRVGSPKKEKARDQDKQQSLLSFFSKK